MPYPTNERQQKKNCHVCSGARVRYLFSVDDYRVVKCDDCGLVFLNPQPSDDELARIQSATISPDGDGHEGFNEVKQAAAKLYLGKIRRYCGLGKGRLLEIGSGTGDFLAAAEAEGWEVAGIDNSAAACDRARQRLKNGSIRCCELQGAELESAQFDLCVISNILEQVRSPLGFLKEIHRVLKPGGTLFIATPSMDSWSARFLRQKWMKFKPEHLTYFDRQTLQTALFNVGFHEVIVEPCWKNEDLVLPQKTQRAHFQMAASGAMIFSRKAEVRTPRVLSVIVPAYNEAKTFSPLMDALLWKKLPNLEMEIIIVESNSTDGTRELARKYQERSGVKLIFEDKARGKGHAVRTGLKAATGDYVLIQDADLEYDLEDYDALLEPIIAGRAAFVLGSRHGGRNVWKMRQFAGQRSLSLFFNLGHWFFTTLINLLFLQRLRDPFTMFKVFRRDCLYGLEFQCNRFDFDYELLIKLIRKGYCPLELPVNYRSRSFHEGKKVRMIRDPLTWLKVLVRLRFAKIDPMSIAEQGHAAGANKNARR